MLIQNGFFENSIQLLIRVLGDKPENLQFLLLSNPNSIRPKYNFENGQRTDEVIGYGVTLHVVGKGAEIEVKIENPNFTFESNGLKELKYVKPVDLRASFVNNRYYFKATDLKLAKSAEKMA